MPLKRVVVLVSIFFVIFLVYVFLMSGYGQVEKVVNESVNVIFQGGISIGGGSISNIYWCLTPFPNFQQDWAGDLLVLLLLGISLVHIYLSYRLLKYIGQSEVVKWYWWGIWGVNCYIWFFMGSIIPLMMRL